MAIQDNQIVSIEYEVKDGDKVVDSNFGGAPLVFMFGKEQIIPGLESGISSMNIGDKGDVLVSADDAYGPVNDEAFQEVPKDQFTGIDLEIGLTLYGQDEEGGTVQVDVKEVKEETVVLDFNHPLAGKSLMFSVVINNIRDASAEELVTGVPQENKKDDECCSTTGSTSGGTGCGCN
ncbi:MAG: peptidylprolyl isomerase [Sulfurimonas sp.]|nr:peptidylprolyl isomerase [Sulfurimonas sp.]